MDNNTDGRGWDVVERSGSVPVVGWEWLGLESVGISTKRSAGGFGRGEYDCAVVDSSNDDEVEDGDDDDDEVEDGDDEDDDDDHDDDGDDDFC